MRLMMTCLLAVATMLPMVACKSSVHPPRQPADKLRVMSFNIRYPNPGDGENYWPNRQQLVVDTMNGFGPDLLGVQEAYVGPANYILEHLDGYRRVGVARDDGKEKGEMSAIYFRADRFELVGHGDFWLSDTPEVPGSVGWDASMTRMATWVVLNDKETGGQIVYINAHLDHRGPKSRLESCKLIRQRLTRLLNAYPGARGIVTGDFNADAMGSEPYDALLAGETPKLVDTFAAVHPDRAEIDGTMHHFTGDTARDRIDWVVVTDDFEVTDASILHTNREGRYPSDHFPVTAVLR